MSKIKKGDEVIVIAGKDKGRQGKVMRVLPDKQRVLVENINLVKKHVKANPQQNKAGGIEERPAPLNISNVAIYNHVTKRADRIGIMLKDGRKVRIFKKTGKLIDV